MSTPINMFIIYAREDMDIKQRLLLHLNPFKNAFNAVIWHDGNIEAGQEWKPHIESRLDQTDIFILLVSVDFMNSEFINQVEFKYAIERHKEKKAIMIPVIINYCQWDIDLSFKEFTFNLKDLQVLPNEGKPIGDWKTPEQAFNNIAAGIRTALSSIKFKREQEQREKEELELQIARNKIGEEKKQATIREKEKAKEEQIKIESQKAEIGSADKIRDQREIEKSTVEEENQILEIVNEPSFFDKHKRKIIIGAALIVIVFGVFLLINSLTSNRETETEYGTTDTTMTVSPVTPDSSSFGNTDETATKEELEKPKIVADQEENKKVGKSKTGNDPQEGIIDEEDKIFEKVEVEATFAGGYDEWKKYLLTNLNANVATDNKAPAGTYTVVVRFVVGKDGSISDVIALTNHGFGMENEAIRVIQKGPLWIPAIQNGRAVRAYRKQPITFVV